MSQTINLFSFLYDPLPTVNKKRPATFYFSAILAILRLGLLRTSPQHRYIVQTSILSFSYFAVVYSLNEAYIFFILVFSYSILSCLSFSVCYFPSVFLCISSNFSFSFCFSLCLLLYFLPVFYLLSFSSDFLCLSSTFSFSFCLFLCLSSTYFLGCLLLSFFASLLLYFPYFFCIFYL